MGARVNAWMGRASPEGSGGGGGGGEEGVRMGEARNAHGIWASVT